MAADSLSRGPHRPALGSGTAALDFLHHKVCRGEHGQERSRALERGRERGAKTIRRPGKPADGVDSSIVHYKVHICSTQMLVLSVRFYKQCSQHNSSFRWVLSQMIRKGNDEVSVALEWPLADAWRAGRCRVGLWFVSSLLRRRRLLRGHLRSLSNADAFRLMS